jgi:hypothetical protein
LRRYKKVLATGFSQALVGSKIKVKAVEEDTNTGRKPRRSLVIPPR